MYKKKLIEVALPLDAINKESAREKSIRHGHPSTLHLWWARRPLATARAVIWASLVDDPSSRPEEFPTEEEQNKERNRLFKILEQLVVWENSNNENILDQAKAEIMKSTDGNLPEFLDPFAGGGAIPLEAARLGLFSHASDLNPIPVMINKAMLEYPQRFYNSRPINPNTPPIQVTQNGFVGIGEDVEYYGGKLRSFLQDRIGKHYPNFHTEKGEEYTPIAWLWSRTIKCSNPACKVKIPLFKSNTLSKKKNNLAYFTVDFSSNNEPIFNVHQGSGINISTVNRKGATCPNCGASVPLKEIREQFKHSKEHQDVLIGVVVEGKSKRLYLEPNEEQIKATYISKPENVPSGKLAYYPGYINPLAYGFEEIASLFSNRQLVFLNTMCEGIANIKEEIRLDALKSGLADSPVGLEEGGDGAKAYSELITVYLAFLLDKLEDYNSSICSWNSSGEKLRNTFGMTGMSMTWDYAEVNPFSNSSGSYNNMLNWVVKAVKQLPHVKAGKVRQFPAQRDDGLREVLISTDPPYYNNVPYADFADFFYVWQRKCIKEIIPELYSTILTPKDDELTADPYFRGGKEEASEYFEEGMLDACKSIYKRSSDNYPVTIYYAYKQVDNSSSDESSSTGWEKMLSAVIESGFLITGTWPVRTEMSSRTRGIGANALASSIVLVCRKRKENAKAIQRRKFITELKKELKDSLIKLQQTNIAPVDMAQSAIGPGMGVFSKYKAVLESDGSPMTIRSALEIINQEVDIFFNEQDSDLHAEDRFCVDLYTQCGFDSIKFGEADTLARAKNTSVEKLAHTGTVFAEKGVVHLIDRDELPERSESFSPLWTITQQLVRVMDKGGVEAAAKFLKETPGRHESMKSLAYRLFTIAEKKNWAQEAYVYNNLVVAWPEIQDRLAELNSNNFETQTLF